jgi:predicted DNA-binding transcriptional regulator AlpA
MKDMLGTAVAAKQAAQRIAVSERQFYLLRKRPDFPQGHQLAPRCVRWLTSELDAWVTAQPAPALAPEPAQLVSSRRYKSGRLVGRSGGCGAAE